MTAVLAIMAMGFAATSVGLAVKLYVDRGMRAGADMRALEANARAAAAESQNTDLADQLIRADAEKVSLRARIDEVIKQRDRYRTEAINALAETPGGAGRLLNELGMPDVSDGTAAEDRRGGEAEALPDTPLAGMDTVPGRRPGHG